VLSCELFASNKDVPPARVFQGSHQVRCALLSPFAIAAKGSEGLAVFFSKLLALFEVLLGYGVSFGQH
jgi:hypothetical protein